MRRGYLVASITVFIGLAGGIGSAAWLRTDSADTRDVGARSTETADTRAIDTSGSGPDCIGGLCPDNLPDQIAYVDVPAYLSVLKQALIATPTPDAANDCHVVSHEIGRRAIAGGSSVAKLLELDDGRCLYGYQHGVLEGWSLQSSREELVEGIPDACSAYADGSTLGGLGAGEIDYARGSCAHGVGHAIALQAVGTVREAVAYCGGVGEGQIGGCAGGVFMAYSLENPSQGGAASTLELAADEVRVLCQTLEGEYQVECWSKLWLLGERVGIKPADIAKLCPEETKAPSCGKGVGEGLYYGYNMEAEVAMEACPLNVKSSCIKGVAWSEANAWAGSGGSAETYESVCVKLGGNLLLECQESESEGLKGSVK